MPNSISDKAISRLSLYRRLLDQHRREGHDSIFSHEIAALSGCTAAQVRRDLMAAGCTGSPSRGYSVSELIDGIGRFLDRPSGIEPLALVGVGNLGRAILSFFTARRPNLKIVAAFDRDPSRSDRVIHGCRCHAMDDLESVIDAEDIAVAILAVPSAQAQGVADRLVRAGVRGILNFAPVALRVPPTVYVENVDMTSSLEKVSYFARQSTNTEKGVLA